MIERKGITLAEFAAQYGLGESQLFNWLKRDEPPLAKHWPKLAGFFGVSVSYIVSGTPDKVEVQQPAGLLSEEGPAYDQIPSDREFSRHALPSEIRASVRRQIESTLAAAGDDAIRLGWIAEQVQAHVTAPPHWKKGPVMVPIYDPAQDQALSSETGLPIRRSERPAQSA